MREPEEPQIESLKGSFFLAEKNACNLSATCYNRVVPQIEGGILHMPKTLSKKELVKEASSALYFLKEIYSSFDQLNGHLHELIEVLDKEEYEWFHDFWTRFPTYNELDDLDDFLTKFKKENQEE